MAWVKMTNPHYLGVYFAVPLLALVLSMFFVGKTAKTLTAACCTCWILFSGIYLVAVGMQIRGNHELATGSPRLEADTIRKLAGI